MPAERAAMTVMSLDLDRGGPKDSENTLNTFLTKTNGKGFDDLVLICLSII